jgi:hypothetical protein
MGLYSMLREKKKPFCRGFFFVTLAEAVGFAYMLQAACALASAQLRLPPAGRAGALLAYSAAEKKKPLCRGFFFVTLAEAVGFEPTIQV